MQTEQLVEQIWGKEWKFGFERVDIAHLETLFTIFVIWQTSICLLRIISGIPWSSPPFLGRVICFLLDPVGFAVNLLIYLTDIAFSIHRHGWTLYPWNQHLVPGLISVYRINEKNEVILCSHSDLIICENQKT